MFFDFNDQLVKKYLKKETNIKQFIHELNFDKILYDIYFEKEKVSNIDVFQIKSDRRINSCVRLNRIITDYLLIQVDYNDNSTYYYFSNVMFDQQLILTKEKEKIIFFYDTFKSYIKNNFEQFYDKLNENIFFNFMKQNEYSYSKVHLCLKLGVDLEQYNNEQ